MDDSLIGREEIIRRYVSANLSLIKLCSPARPHEHDHKPCGNPGKVPVEHQWQKMRNLPMNEKRIKSMARHSGNVGIAIPDQLVVLDADSLQMTNRIANELDRRGLIYWRQNTGKGAHFIVCHPIGCRIKNLTKCIIDEMVLDTRTAGGQIVAFPSRHYSGRVYEWTAGRAPWEIPMGLLSTLPADWAVKLTEISMKEKKVMNKKYEMKQVASGGVKKTSGLYLMKGLEQLLDGVPEGSRHGSATRIAGYFLGRGVRSTIAEKVLILWDRLNTPPLQEEPKGLQELQKIIKDVTQKERDKKLTRSWK